MAHIIHCPEVSWKDVERCMADRKFAEDVTDKACFPDEYDAICETLGSGCKAIFRKAASMGPDFVERLEDAAYELAQLSIIREWEAYPYHDEKELDDDL